MKKLQNIGASVLWLISLIIFLAQGYRAVAYYLFDKPMEWNYIDVIIAIIAFMAMFAPAKLKSLVVEKSKKIIS